VSLETINGVDQSKLVALGAGAGSDAANHPRVVFVRNVAIFLLSYFGFRCFTDDCKRGFYVLDVLAESILYRHSSHLNSFFRWQVGAGVVSPRTSASDTYQVGGADGVGAVHGTGTIASLVAT